MRRTIVYISLILAFVCLPSKTWGQCVKKETMNQAADAVILYSDGVFPGAIWELGRTLSDKKTDATIRHRVNEGNGSNINVNSKLPFRILIAPTDVSGTLTWSGAMGFENVNNNNLNATPVGATKQGGCATYFPNPGTDFPGYVGIKGWRLPTQRELQLMWLLRSAIDQAFLPRYPKREILSGTYWSSTEENATNAWCFGFGGPSSQPGSKTTPRKVRCVRDY